MDRGELNLIRRALAVATAANGRIKRALIPRRHVRARSDITTTEITATTMPASVFSGAPRKYNECAASTTRTSHRYVSCRYRQIAERTVDHTKIITLHLVRRVVTRADVPY